MTTWPALCYGVGRPHFNLTSKMKYRIKYRVSELVDGYVVYYVLIQCKRVWRWRAIWKRSYMLCEEDYAISCAEEILEKLESEI